MKKIKEQAGFEFADNCFDLLRLYSAFYVMTLHIMRHVRLQEVSHIFDWWNGVVLLFCISGFLIPASMERSRGVWDFLKKRVLRIIPSLWVCIIVGVAVAVAFCGFVFDKTFAVWFTGQLVFIRDFPQPDFINNFGIGNFNASLWTIIFTVQFYIITAIVYRFMKKRKLLGWIAALAVCAALNLIVPYMQEVLPETGRSIVSHSCLPYLYMYFAGWFMYEYRDKIVPVLTHTKVLCIILFVLRALYCEKFGVRVGEYMDIIQVLLLCMLTVGVGYSFGRIRFKIDLSYGLYLYHMIVVDVFVQLGLVRETKYIIAVYAVSIVCSLLSYYLVDRNVAAVFKRPEQTKFREEAPAYIQEQTVEEETDF